MGLQQPHPASWYVSSLCFLVTSETTPERLTNMTAQMWGKQEQQWACQTGHGKVHETSTLHGELQAGKWTNLEYRVRPSQGEQPAGCPVTNAHLWNIHTSNIIWTQQVIFRKIYIYTNTCIPAITIRIKRGDHKFEGELGGLTGGFREREESKCWNETSKITKLNNNSNKLKYNH